MPAILPNSGLLNSAVAMAQDGIRGRIASIAKLQLAIAYGDVARNDEGFLFQDAGDEQLVTRLAGGDGLIIYDASAHEKNLWHVISKFDHAHVKKIPAACRVA